MSEKLDQLKPYYSRLLELIQTGADMGPDREFLDDTRKKVEAEDHRERISQAGEKMRSAHWEISSIQQELSSIYPTTLSLELRQLANIVYFMTSLSSIACRDYLPVMTLKLKTIRDLTGWK